MTLEILMALVIMGVSALAIFASLFIQNHFINMKEVKNLGKIHVNGRIRKIS